MKDRISAFSIFIDPVTMPEAVDKISEWLEIKELCHYVVTPNVDHVVQLQDNPKLRASYGEASLVLTDGKPVRFVLDLLKKPVPEVVTGSDLVPNIFNKWQNNNKKLRVFLLGGASHVPPKAAEAIHHKWPLVEVAGFYSPPVGFESDQEENQLIVDKISSCKPDLLIIGLGAPKQELWIHNHYKKIEAGAALCVGATIDFLAGEQKRAPVWMQKLALEWLFRMLSNPGRLVKRYLNDGLRFPVIVWQEYKITKKQR